MADKTPTAIIQQALDAVGVDHLLGDIEDGTRPSQVGLRAYRNCLQQLLRVAPWNFARKQVPLTLLADATGQSPNVSSTVIDPAYVYEYGLPEDAMKIRYIPWSPLQNPGAPSNNIQPANANSPITTGTAGPFNGQRLVPAKFLISFDQNFPAAPGSQSWEVQGVSPQGSTVILTNVQNACAVYTYLCLYPSVWDALFRAALVAYIASEIALPLSSDKKIGMTLRVQQIAIAKEKIMEARAADGKELWSTSDIPTDWLRFRNTGGPWQDGFGGGGAGYYWGGYDGCCGVGSVVGGATF